MNDARLRKATEMEKRMGLGRLFSALKPRDGDAQDVIEVYVLALRDVTFHALDEVIAQIISGKLPKIGKKFAPTTAELGEAVRDHMAAVQRQIELAVERVAIEDNRPKAVHKPLLWERQKMERQRMADEGRKLLFTVDNIDQLRARRADLPKDFGYIAITGEVWGPPGSANASDPAPAMADGDLPW